MSYSSNLSALRKSRAGTHNSQARPELIALIIGKSEQNAQAILASQTGVGKVKITVANTTSTTLPTSAKDITVNVVAG